MSASQILRSAILARHPEHVGSALVIAEAGGDEEKIREPVNIFENRGRDALAGLVLELGDEPLGAATHGAGEMQVGRGGAAARQDERAQRLEPGVEAVDLAFQ